MKVWKEPFKLFQRDAPDKVPSQLTFDAVWDDKTKAKDASKIGTALQEQVW